MKKQLLLTFLAVLTLYVTATAQTTITIDEWTFTDGVAPQISDVQGKTMGNWDPSLAGTSVFGNVWTGATSVDWATGSNWSTGAAPTADDNVLIPDVTNAPVIGSSTNVSVNDIVIDESDGLTINSGGSLIVNGTASGNVTYNRTLGTTNWYLMSSPVAGVTFDNAFVTANTIASGTGNNRGVATYNTTTDKWTYLQFGGTINSTAGVGYSVKQETAGNVAFTGTINTSDTGVDVVLETTGNRFNLLGNPYTSHVNSATFLASESAISDTQTIWVWNQGLGVAGSYEVQGTDDGFYLVPAQGFFVKANASGGTFNFAESNQSSTGGTFQKLNTTQIKLWISEGDVKNYCRIKYSDNATQGFDVGLDGEMFGGSESSFAVYSHLLADNEGKKYQLQALPNSEYEKMVVPVGVIASAGKQITFSAETMNLPAGLKVFLEDRETNTFTRLDEANTEYTITLDKALHDIGRFYVHTSASALSTPEVNLQNVSIYATNSNNLRIVGIAQGNASVKLYNIVGKEVLSHNFTSNGVSDLTLPKLTRGIYIVQLTTEEGKLNKKIILE